MVKEIIQRRITTMKGKRLSTRNLRLLYLTLFYFFFNFILDIFFTKLFFKLMK